VNEKEVTAKNSYNFRFVFNKEQREYQLKHGLQQKSNDEIDVKLLLETTESVLPYFPYQEDGVDAEMIQNDFPEVNEENYEDHAPIIEDYYSNSLNTVVAKTMNDPSFLDVLDGTGGGSGGSNNNPPQLPDFKVIEIKDGETKEMCFYNNSNTSLLGYLALEESESAANNYAKIHYGNLDRTNTKRDAFRHTIWNALLCRKFKTISSRKKKLNFAIHVSEINEQCGANGYATRQMDYHNNAIGRTIYNSNTTFKKIGWIKTGLNQPSEQQLVTYAKQQVENNPVFIDMSSFSSDKNEAEEKAYFEVKKVTKTRTVYLSKKSL